MYPGSAKENIAINRRFSGPRKESITLMLASMLIASLFLTYIILSYGMISFVMITAGLIAIPFVYTIIAYPQTGILIMLVMSYLILFLGRFNIDFPMGTMMDVIIFLLVISFFLKQKYRQDWSFVKNSTSIVVLCWIAYNLLEVVNPSADSRLAWLYTVRPIAFVALTYFLFQLFITDAKFIRTIFKLWIGLSVIAALYALKQEFVGFADFEMKWLKADPVIENLYFIGNHWRKFSVFTDPVTFAYNMVVASILCIGLMTGPVVRWKRITLGLLACLFFVAMLYSGTRGAYVLYPVAFLFYGVLRYNKKVMIVGAVIVVIAVGLILMPTSNYTLYRFQSAFKPNKDASYILRKNNQKRIQPFIQSHPLGGGIGSTGVWGKRFSPYSYLANFPPDSGYVRVAVEAGWVGLLLFCTFIFVVLKTGITNYFLIKDPALKSYCLAMVMILFAVNIGNYPQEAFVQYPMNIYFYMAIAILDLTLKMDRQQQKVSINQPAV